MLEKKLQVKNRVLLIDDDALLGELLKTYLKQEGFDVTVETDGFAGQLAALTGDYDIVILDVMLPKSNGVDILRQIRVESRVPILMLTARGDDVDRIIGLELGADDYVPKPSSPRELTARLRAILRRLEENTKSDTTTGVVDCGALQLSPSSRTATWYGAPVCFTSTEFSLILELAKRAGEVVDKNTLSLNALGRPLTPFDKNIHVHISSIRQKLKHPDPVNPTIVTVRGVGYQLIR